MDRTSDMSRFYRPPKEHLLTPEGEIGNRCQTAGRWLSERGLDAALLVQPVDVFYYSGTRQDAHLLLTDRGVGRLMVRRDLARAAAESPLEACGLDGLSRLPALVADALGRPPRRLGLELDVLPVNRFDRYRALFPETETVDVGESILAQRSIKSEWELDLMRRAGRLARDVYGAADEFLAAGRTEIEAAGLMTAKAYAGGHQNMLRTRAFDAEMHSWHVISGLSGCVAGHIDAPFTGFGLSPAFPAGAGHKTIKPDEPILIDFGICLEGYQVDLTRTFCIGRPPEPAADAYRGLEIIQQTLVERLRPGARGPDLFRAAVDRADELELGDHFLGAPDNRISFVGHGVGLEIAEPPLLARRPDHRLVENQVVALELKMVLPGVGAVGLENSYRIRPGPPELLTPAADGLIRLRPPCGLG
jgi:Xaa-Pro aminopeptidase